MAPATVPLIDLSAGRGLPLAVREACEQIGFLIITGHGVLAELSEHTAGVAREFFDLPEPEKKRLVLTPGGAGYSPLQGERLAATLGEATPADLKESLNVAADFEATPWPARPAELRAACINYFQAMDRLAGQLMRLFALALELPAGYFADKIDHSSSFLRIINYPAPERAPEPGQLRAGAHTDYGTLTILRLDDTHVAGGLQVHTRAGEWLAVEAPPGALVVNLGDMMMRWTNDRWVSTLHRVVNPPAELARGSRRQSLVFFHNPNPEALIACLPGCCGPEHPPRYAPIRAGEFIAEKSREAYGR